MAAKKRVTVNLSDDEHSIMSEISDKFHLSLAWLGRRAIADLIEKYNAGPEQFPNLLLSHKHTKTSHDADRRTTTTKRH